MKSTGKYFLTWDEAFQSGVQQAGGKGWNLGRLAQYGFKIPMGGVLTTRAYDEFIKHNKLQDTVKNISQSVTVGNIDETNNQDRLSQLRRKIKEGSIPQLIVEEFKTMLDSLGILERPTAVRSSASAEDSAKASFAGIHESFLNVSGLGNILESVKGCYASLWSNQAIVYRRKLNISDDEVVTGVVVMEMVDAQAEFSFLSAAASLPVGPLFKILTKYFADRAPMVFNALMVGGSARITSADQGYKLNEFTYHLQQSVFIVCAKTRCSSYSYSVLGTCYNEYENRGHGYDWYTE